MSCGCNASSPPYQAGGKKRNKRTKRQSSQRHSSQRHSSQRQRKKSRKRNRRSKLYGGNYLTGTIADGADGTAFGKMTGAQFAGSHQEVNGDVIIQPLGR